MKKIKLSKNEDLNLKEGLDKFIRYCKIKNLSEDTIEYYKNSYNYFIEFLQSEYSCDGTLMLSELTGRFIEEFTLWLGNTHKINNTSINTRLRGLRAFLYYLMEQELVGNFKICLLKSKDKIKKTYTNAELKKLLKKPNLSQCSFAEYRNWVIINFLLATGIRARTLRNLKIKDVDIKEAVVFIREVKNRKEQIIPLSKSLVKILIDYLEYRKGESEDYLFCTIYSTKLKSSSLSSAIRKYNLKRVSKTSIHLFRHTFAKKWILKRGFFQMQKIKQYVEYLINTIKFKQ